MANILLIDDDKDIQRLLQFTLKRAGHVVNAAYDGIQGLQYAENNPPDLIVCDVMMPRMTGYEFCRQARSKPPLKDTPIIVFSARFQPVDKQTALDAGATEYLPKNTAPDALVQRIAELLSKPEAQQPPLQGTVAVFSLRGGAGATSLAINLAMAIRLSRKKSITLVDLAPMGGHTALMMGLRPSASISQIMGENNGDISAQELAPYLLKHKTGVQLLASAPTFGQSESVTTDQLLKLVESVKANFPVALLDIPQLLDPRISPVLQLVDKIVLVLTPDIPSVQATVTALQGFMALGFDNQQTLLVVNQIMPYHGLPVETIQKAVKRQVTAVIPFEGDMVKATNAGKPLLMLSPQSSASIAIAHLAAKLFA